MAKILCLETSGVTCSVAVAENELLLIEKTENKGKFTHAESLHIFIQYALAETDLRPNDLDCIAISSGPGSYTGLRIGVSAAKGLCFALEKPLIAISTLQILASQVDNGAQIIIPMLDARRMEVYTAVFNQHYEQITPTEAKILDGNSYSDWLSQGDVTFLGDGSDKFSAICHNPNAFFIKNAFPQAKDMIRHVFQKYQQQLFEDIAYFEPNYLK